MWYADLPLYLGKKADCLMVAGAPSFLNFLARNKIKLTLDVSRSRIDNPIALLNKQRRDCGKWAYYNTFIFSKDIVKGTIGLCPVSSWFFGGDHPDRIYIKEVK